MPGSMLSTSPAYRTDRSPPFLASLGAAFCAGSSPPPLSSPPQPATASASAAATANMARQCAATLICAYPPLRLGQGHIAPTTLQLGRSVVHATANSWRNPHRRVSRLRLEHHVLRALPEHRPAELAQLVGSLGDREEVVARELADDAREARPAVRKQDLGLAVAARVEQDLARRRVAGVVLERQVGLEVAERDPRRLAAPAHVDDLVAKRQHRLEGGAGLGRRGDPVGAELEPPGRDVHVAHPRSPFVGVSRRPSGGSATIRPSWKTVVPRTSVRTTRPRNGRPANG